MTEIEETRLPGVGLRHDFVTEGGDRIGMVSHSTGRRELLIYDRNDPDSCRSTVVLEEDDAAALADLLGMPRISEHLTNLQQSVAGLAIDWIPLEPSWAHATATIGDTQMRSRTGVSAVAVIRGGDTFASPAPDFRFEPGDTVVVVGTPEGIRNAVSLLKGD